VKIPPSSTFNRPTLRGSLHNDQKANFLNYAAHSFATALLLTMVLVLFVSVSLLFKRSGPSEVRLVPGSTVEVRRPVPTRESDTLAKEAPHGLSIR